MNLLRRFAPLASAAVLAAALAWPTGAQEYVGGGTGVPENTAGYKKWMMFQEAVADKSGGTLEITPIISGALGSEENILSSLRRGRVQVAIVSSMIVASVVEEAVLLQMPYLFDSQGEADFVLDTVLADVFADLMADKGLVFLSWDEVGFHQVYGSRPLLTPADTQGIRFRISSSPAARLFAESIGADAIALPFSDLIMGLQTSLVSAGENAIILYAQTGVAELAPHLTMTNHSFAVNFFFADAKWFNNLSDDHRAAVRASWPAMNLGREMTRAEWQADLARADELGFTIHDLTPAQRQAWRMAVEPAQHALLEIAGERGKDVLDAVHQGKRAFADQTSVK